MDKLAQLTAERDTIYGKLQNMNETCSRTEGFTDEERAKWDALTDQVEVIDEQMKMAREDAERIAKLSNIQRQAPATETPAEPEAIHRDDVSNALRSWLLKGHANARPEYRKAAEKIGLDTNQTELQLRFAQGPGPRNGKDITERYETRAQAVGTDAAGGYMVNALVNAAYEASLLAYGSIRDICTVIRTETGADLPVPTMNDTANEAVLQTENTQATEQDVTLSQVLLKDYAFNSKLVRVSWQFLNDAYINVDQWLGMVLGERMARGQLTYHTTGTGSSQPTGYVTGAGDSGVTLASATAITYLELVEILHSLDPAYRANATWTFHDTWMKYMRKIVDSNGLPIWNPGMASGGGDSLSGGVPSTILDRPYRVNQKMPTATSTKCITIGDMSKFWIRDINADFRLVRLNERYAEYGQVAFMLWQRNDSKLIDAGTDPIKYATAG